MKINYKELIRCFIANTWDNDDQKYSINVFDKRSRWKRSFLLSFIFWYTATQSFQMQINSISLFWLETEEEKQKCIRLKFFIHTHVHVNIDEAFQLRSNWLIKLEKYAQQYRFVCTTDRKRTKTCKNTYSVRMFRRESIEWKEQDVDKTLTWSNVLSILIKWRSSFEY